MENWKLLLAGIRNALSDLVSKTFNVNGSVEVSNLPEVQHVVIDNHQEPTETVVVSNLVDYKEELNKIIGELIKVPKDIKTADYTPIIDALKEVVRTLEDDKTDYSPIILSIESAVKELKTKFPEVDYSPIINTIKGIQQFNLSQYLEEGELPVIINEKQIKKLVDAFGKKAGQVVAASVGGGGYDTVWIKNVAGTKINPATEEKQLPDNHQVTVSNIASTPLITGFATETTLAKIPGLSIPIHDYISLSYTGSNLTGVVFKTGGSGGTTVATLTLAYSGSTLTSVTKT